MLQTNLIKFCTQIIVSEICFEYYKRYDTHKKNLIWKILNFKKEFMKKLLNEHNMLSNQL